MMNAQGERSPDALPCGVSHSAAHYLLAIHRLRQEFGYARATDVAERLQVSRGAASMAVAHLKRRELATEDPHRFLLLTAKGQAVVRHVEQNFEIWSRFLSDVLAVPEQHAQSEACNVEHLLGLETGKRLVWLMESVLADPKLEAAVKDIMASFPARKKKPRTGSRPAKTADASGRRRLS